MKVKWSITAIVVLAGAVSSGAADSVVVGGRTYERKEFRLSDGTASSEKRPTLAYSAHDGTLVVTWDTGHFAYWRRFAPDGTPLTPDVAVGGGYSGQSETWYSHVAPLPGGTSMVVTEHHPAHYTMDIYARVIASDGAYLTDFFQVNSYADGSQKYPRVGANAAGECMIIWQSYWPTGDDTEIIGRRFDAAGTPLTDEFVVNKNLMQQQDFPKIAMNGSGDSMVVWTSHGEGKMDVWARRYDPTGAPLGPDLAVADEAAIWEYNPAVAMNSHGGGVVTWQQHPAGEGGGDVYCQRYDADGSLIGAPCRVNDTTTASNRVPNVHNWDDGSFVVAWYADVEGSSECWARVFDPDGEPIDDPFRINTETEGLQHSPDVACGPDGQMAFVWQEGSDAAYVTLLIPEPAALALLVLGGVALIRGRRRRRIH